ncbi:MAG TPA: patatin-like phospholipase family protein [Usitatibacter sp.]|nr:patatin-like phospholipase family protein [Usitatibacter sp.]
MLRLAPAAALACALLATAPALAQQPAPARPAVGLVLGGGGARGGAHLGVLEVLEELHVPVDCIAGTSMGALVGGAFAAGVSPQEMRAKIAATDWAAMFDDSASRDLQSYRRRTFDDRFFSGLEFGVTPEGLRYREGAIAGEKIKLFFGDLVRADLGERNIEQLPLPLTLIATDIVTGERVAMRSGNLTSAMRASMSVPGAIAPVTRDGHKLVDGGLVDNVPIQEVRDRCKADVVIAINVGSPLMTEKEVSGAVSVVGQMVNLLTEQNVQRSLALLTPRDIYMRPELGGITAMDFGKQLDAAAIGRASAMAQADKLRALSVSPEEYAAFRARIRSSPPPQPPIVDQVIVADTRYVNPDELRSNVTQQEGERLDSKRLADDLILIYSRGDLQTLDYSVLRERDKTILKLVPVEKSWGPDYLRFGLNLATDFRFDSAFNLRALYRRTWLNSYGGEWLTVGQVGTDQVFATEFYQPIDKRQNWFIRPYIGAESHKRNLYLNGERIAEYRVPESYAGLDLGANLGIYGQAHVGWQERKASAHLETGSPFLPDTEARTGALTADVAIDQFDIAFFPTRGYKADINYFDARRVSSGDPFAKLQGNAEGALSLGGFILRPYLEAGRAVSGKLQLPDLFPLGGLGRLSAFAPGQILTDEYILGTLRAEYRLLKPIPVIGLSVVAGLNYERAHVKNPVTEPNLAGNIDSYGFYLGATSALGPLYFGWSGTQDRRGRLFLWIGTP